VSWCRCWALPSLLVAFLINLSGNRLIEGTASFIGILKIGGIIVFGLVGVWIADSLAVDFTRAPTNNPP